ncbi:hypothetical protein I2I11_11665 [Pontibacter sp. 172403-2]|nr:hypothetical protein [Pontibacter sp. 172403-2]
MLRHVIDGPQELQVEFLDKRSPVNEPGFFVLQGGDVLLEEVPELLFGQGSNEHVQDVAFVILSSSLRRWSMAGY